jgi:hypothetical protein
MTFMAAFLYLWDAAPRPVMEAFWRKALPSTRQHVMGFPGCELQLPPEKHRGCGIAYWESRLPATTAAADPSLPSLRSAPSVNGAFAVGIEPVWRREQLTPISSPTAFSGGQPCRCRSRFV